MKTHDIVTVGLGDVRLANRSGYCFPHKLHNGDYGRKDGDNEAAATGSAASKSQLTISSKLSFV